jgi:preprotein translocase subunit SecE
LTREDMSKMTDEKRTTPPTPQPDVRRERTGPRQFVRETRGELKRVQWPTRRELLSYSAVVLVAVSILTLYVFGLDQAFGQIVFWMFG